MYKITVNKVLYTKTTRGTRKTFKRILTTEATTTELTSKMIRLKQTFKDFDYNIDFVRI